MSRGNEIPIAPATFVKRVEGPLLRRFPALFHSSWARDYTFAMRRSVFSVMRLLSLLVAVLASTPGAPRPQRQPPPAPTIFDPDPNHLWNRTYACVFIRQTAEGRQYGADTLDPLLWWQTRYLLSGQSHRRALRCLDEFLRAHAEHLVADPLKHAILQHDLWAVFDWAAAGEDFPQQRRDLEVRLAAAIYRLAISLEQANGLPDTYAAAVASRQFATAYDTRDPQQPFLPPDLFQPGGPWVCVSAQLDEPTAIVHFSGRSRFLVFLRLPGGRAETLTYVHNLRSSHQPPLLVSDSRAGFLNLALPQFPAGTHVALVRQAILIDKQGHLVATNLTESVQLRVYHAVTPGTKYVNYIGGPSSHDQDFVEFRMRRAELFDREGNSLAAISPADTEFATFSTHGVDAFESAAPLPPQGVILKRCQGCHSDSGIHSVQSRLQWLKSPATSAKQSADAPDDPIAWETQVTIERKLHQPDFTLLHAFWRSGASVNKPGKL